MAIDPARIPFEVRTGMAQPRFRDHGDRPVCPIYRVPAWRKPNEDGADRPLAGGWAIGWGERFISCGSGVSIPESKLKCT